MVRLNELFINAQAMLNRSGIENSRFEAKCIFEQVFDLSFEKLILNPERIIPEHYIRLIEDMLKKRISGVPLQYILGEWEFYGLTFIVGDGVLIPRQDTETLVDVVLEYARTKRKPKIMDLCSGTGCIAIALDKNLSNSEICAVEHSQAALPYLIKNIKLNSSSVHTYDGDVLSKRFSEYFSDFDIIVSNPPYLNSEDMKNLQTEVKHEPAVALDGGSSGLNFYEGIADIWSDCLVSGGMLAFEIGIGQQKAVAEILRSKGFENITEVRDLCGIIRVIHATKI